MMFVSCWHCSEESQEIEGQTPWGWAPVTLHSPGARTSPQDCIESSCCWRGCSPERDGRNWGLREDPGQGDKGGPSEPVMGYHSRCWEKQDLSHSTQTCGSEWRAGILVTCVHPGVGKVRRWLDIVVKTWLGMSATIPESLGSSRHSSCNPSFLEEAGDKSSTCVWHACERLCILLLWDCQVYTDFTNRASMQVFIERKFPEFIRSENSPWHGTGQFKDSKNVSGTVFLKEKKQIKIWMAVK